MMITSPFVLLDSFRKDVKQCHESLDVDASTIRKERQRPVPTKLKTSMDQYPKLVISEEA